MSLLKELGGILHDVAEITRNVENETSKTIVVVENPGIVKSNIGMIRVPWQKKMYIHKNGAIHFTVKNGKASYESYGFLKQRGDLMFIGRNDVSVSFVVEEVSSEKMSIEIDGKYVIDLVIEK